MRNLLGPPLRRVSVSAPAPAAVRRAGGGARVLVAGARGRYGTLRPARAVRHRTESGADAVRAPAKPSPRAPALRDGPGSPDGATGTGLNGLRVPRGAPRRTGPVAYNGDRGGPGDALTCSVACRAPTPFAGTAGPADGVLNSTINEPGPVRARREPAYANPLGHEPDVFDLGTALVRGR
ncbi:hypothetical protein [Streptomyces sp. NPDC101237]|uniref:hypothetical protein n=1 Tax=Streptomyces sp. NPDC101237 TaxID=3366139 RepID=UPI00380B3A76